MNLANASPRLTPSGRLENFGDWSERIASWFAESDGLTLTEAHWEILRLMRGYYREYNIPPIKKLLKREIETKLADGKSKALDSYLDNLFPHGVLIQGTKIAGLPIPMLDAEIEHRYVTDGTIAGTKSESGNQSGKSNQFEFNGKIHPLSPTGNLVDAAAWSESMAEALAQKEGIRLTPEHWEVIRYLRRFYFSYGISPMVKLLMSHLAQEVGEQNGSREYLYGLFPGGPSRQGSRIAGLPEPQGCID